MALHGVYDGEEKEDKIKPKQPRLDEFYCSISSQMFNDPVILEDGHTYERAYIEEWLKRCKTSPLTGAELTSTKLIPNWALKKAITEYKAKIIPKFKVEAKQIEALRQSLSSTTEILKATRSQLAKTESLLTQTQEELEVTVAALEASQNLLNESEARLENMRSTRDRCGFFSVFFSRTEEELNPVPRRTCGRIC